MIPQTNLVSKQDMNEVDPNSRNRTGARVGTTGACLGTIGAGV